MNSVSEGVDTSGPPAHAIVLAAGSGRRMEHQITDKMLHPVAGKPVVRWSVETFAGCPFIHRVIVTFRDPLQRAALSAALNDIKADIEFVRGGAQRSDSVRAALAAVSDECCVFVHDGARPAVTREALLRLWAIARTGAPAALARRVTDTIKQASDPRSHGPAIFTDLPRACLWAMETPQVFPAKLLRAAYAKTVGRTFTDDVAVANAAGYPVTLVENPAPNPKLTHPADLPYLKLLLDRTGPTPTACP